MKTLIVLIALVLVSGCAEEKSISSAVANEVSLLDSELTALVNSNETLNVSYYEDLVQRVNELEIVVAGEDLDRLRERLYTIHTRFLSDKVCMQIGDECCIGDSCSVSTASCDGEKTVLGCNTDCTPITDCIVEEEKDTTELTSLENEIDILLEAKNLIGSDHYQEILDKYKLLEDLDDGSVKTKLDQLMEFTPDYTPIEEEELPDDYIAARPDPEYDNFLWTLPSTASSVRLSLPASITEFLFNEHGGIGGYGLHSGGHPEGLDHTWIELKPGTPVKSWADGTVQQVQYNGNPPDGEYHIYIDYGQNLMGIHMEVMTPYVEKGQEVKNGQEVGLGMSFSPDQSSAEMSLVDFGRTDGVRAWGGGSYVSVFDYLKNEDKQLLVTIYRERVIDTWMRDGTRVWGFEPSEPYLTNRLLIHEEGRLNGSWYLTSHKWEEGGPKDIFSFVEADHPYFKGNVFRAIDDTGDFGFKGEFEVDYLAGQIKMISDSSIEYGIFDIDESGERPTLTLQYQEGSYPVSFTDPLVYTLRSNIPRREDAVRLGSLDSV